MLSHEYAALWGELERTLLRMQCRRYQKVIEARIRKALQSAQKYSLVANSVKSDIVVEPTIKIIK